MVDGLAASPHNLCVPYLELDGHHVVGYHALIQAYRRAANRNAIVLCVVYFSKVRPWSSLFGM